MAHRFHGGQILAEIFKRSWTTFSGYRICHSLFLYLATILLRRLFPSWKNFEKEGLGEIFGGANRLRL
jgi:hypothetical protein